MRHFTCAVLLAFAVVCVNAQAVNTAPVLFKDSQFSVAHEFDIAYGKGTVENGEMDLLLDLYKPQGANVPRLKPAFIGVHGGGFVMGDKRGPPTNMAELAKDMATRGYVAVSINYRLVKDKPVESGAELERARAMVDKVFARRAQGGEKVDPRIAGITAAQMAAVRAGAIADTAKALTWIVANATRYGIDPKRITIGGMSAGAGTILNFVYVSDNEANRHARTVIDMWGSLDQLGLSKMEKTDPPFVIIHGTKDPVVPFQGALALDRRAKELGIAHVFYPVEGAGHGAPLSTKTDGASLYQHIADFNYQHLDLANLR